MITEGPLLPTFRWPTTHRPTTEKVPPVSAGITQTPKKPTQKAASISKNVLRAQKTTV